MVPSQLISHFLLCGLILVCLPHHAKCSTSTPSPSKPQSRNWLLNHLSAWKYLLNGGKATHGTLHGTTRQHSNTGKSTTKSGHAVPTPHSRPSITVSKHSITTQHPTPPHATHPSTAQLSSSQTPKITTTHAPLSHMTPTHIASTHRLSTTKGITPTARLTSRSTSVSQHTPRTTMKSSRASTTTHVVPHSTKPRTTSLIQILSDGEKPVGEISKHRSRRSAVNTVHRYPAARHLTGAMSTASTVRTTTTSFPNTTTTTDLPEVQVLSELESEIFSAIANDLGYGNVPKPPAEAGTTKRTSRHSTTRRHPTRTRSTPPHRPPPPGEYARLLEMYLGGPPRPMHQQQRPQQMMYFGGSAEGD